MGQEALPKYRQHTTNKHGAISHKISAFINRLKFYFQLFESSVLGAFSKLRKTTIKLHHICLSVHLSVCVCLSVCIEQLGSQKKDFNEI